MGGSAYIHITFDMTSSDIEIQLSQGSQQWQALWRPFARQWSQPALKKLCAQVLKSSVVHVSQIKGFSVGSLREPGPKVQLGIGLVNQAIAAANGEKIEAALHCPGDLEELWKGKEWLRNPDGSAMGPLDITATLMGLKDHRLDLSRSIPLEREEEVCRTLARYLRMELGKQGVDWMGMITSFNSQSVIAEDLLMGRNIPGDLLIRELPNVAQIVALSPDTLWSVIEDALQ